MTGRDDELERLVADQVARQPDVPEWVHRGAIGARLGRIRREAAESKARGDRWDRIEALAQAAGIPHDDAEAALIAREAREAAATRRANVDAAARVLDGASVPTNYARQKIAEITLEYPRLARSAKRVSMAAMTRKVGLDRETISAWVKRGWMTWPPEKPQV